MSEMAWPEPGSRPPGDLLEGLYADDEGLERRLAPLLRAHRDAVEAAARERFGLTPLSAAMSDEEAGRFREGFGAVASGPAVFLPTRTDAREGASCHAPGSGALIEGSEDELRAIAVALKPAGRAIGAVSAAAAAGVILAGLRAAGWDVTRRAQ